MEQAGLIYMKQGIDGGAFVKEVDVSVVSDSITRSYDPQFHRHHLGLHKAIYEAVRTRNLNRALDLLTEHSLYMQKYLAGSESEQP